MKLSMLVTVILFGAAGCAAPADSPGPSGAAASAPGSQKDALPHAAVAAASLETLAHLVTPQKLLGFKAATEVASGSLADPLPMFMVGLDALRTYRPGDDPRPLVLDQATALYPVIVGGEVRSSVLFRKVDGDWKATQFGRANLAKFAHEGRRRVSAARGVAESGVSIVEIPTMSAQMLGHEEGGVPMLTALLDVPGTDIHAGATLRASDVFAKLQPLAALNDGKAPN